MRISKVLSVVALVLLASQVICGCHLANHPEAVAGGGLSFHTALGMLSLVVVIAATVGVYRQARKFARDR